jgi:hypothetical protein
VYAEDDVTTASGVNNTNNMTAAGAANAASSSGATSTSSSTAASSTILSNNAGDNKDMDEWSDELLQTVLQQSIRDVAMNRSSNGGDVKLDENNANDATSPAVSTAVSTTVTSTASSNANITITTAAPTNPRYQVKVIRDITYPKNSVVPVGSVFRKVWSVKNTGTTAWPFDTCVRVHKPVDCPCEAVLSEVVKQSENGEDKYYTALFCDKDINIHLGSIEPGREATVAVTMNVSKKAVAATRDANNLPAGEYIRCISAFCVATTTSTPFTGDLLIMDIIVSDDGACNASCSALLSGGSSMSSTNTSAKLTEGWQMVTSTSNIYAKGNDNAAATTGAGAGASNADEDVALSTASAPTLDSSVASTGASTAASASNGSLDGDAVNWSYELQTLGDMGFTDLSVVLPLLKANLKMSKSSILATFGASAPNTDANRQHMEGMQAVVAALLSQSLMMRV